MCRPILLTLAAGLTLLCAHTVQAGVIFHTSAATFNDAVTTGVFSDFEGIVADNGSLQGNPFLVDGVAYSQTSGGSATVCGKGTACSGNPFDSALMASNNGAPLNIDLTGLGSPVLGAGGIFGDVNSGPSAAAIMVYGALGVLLDTQNVMVEDLGAGLLHSFFGWTTTGDDVITRIVFDMEGSFEAVDDMQFAFERTDVPEPGTLALLGIGLLGMGFARRKRA